MREAGCQPPWRRFSFDGMLDCDNWTMLNQYNNEAFKIRSALKLDNIKLRKPLQMEWGQGGRMGYKRFIPDIKN